MTDAPRSPQDPARPAVSHPSPNPPPATRPAILLIAPNGSYRTAPFLNAAAKLGLDTIIASESEHALVAMGQGAVRVNFAQPEDALARLLSAAAERRIVAVIGTDDVSIALAAQAAARWGFPYNDVESVRIARRKDRARACLSRAGVRVPAHRRIDLQAELTQQFVGLDFPVVLKPIALSASRGVMRADDAPALLQACARLSVILREVTDAEERRYALIESFVPGCEVAVEGLLVAGELEILALFDKPDPLDGPFFEETYYITPSRLPAARQRDIAREVQAACRAYGLREGPVHAECRVNDAGVWILEVAARTIGGLCGRLLRFGTGYSLEELVLKHATRASVARERMTEAAGVLMIPVPGAGVLRRIEGLSAAERVPHIEEVNIQVREGYELVPLPEGATYLGFIFARAPTPAQVEAALRAAHAQLRIVLSPLWKASVA